MICVGAADLDGGALLDGDQASRAARQGLHDQLDVLRAVLIEVSVQSPVSALVDRSADEPARAEHYRLALETWSHEQAGRMR